MIQLFLNSGLDLLRYGLQNGTVRLFLAAELMFVLLGAVCGVLARSGKRQFICLSVPGVLGCAPFLYIHSDLGRMVLTDAHIWLPALAEDLVAFSIVSCAVLAFFRNRRGRTDSGRR